MLNYWRDAEAHYGMDGHDFVLLPDGNMVAIGHSSFEYDLSKVSPTMPRGLSVVLDDQLVLLKPDGTVLARWSSKSFFSPEDTIVFLKPKWANGAYEYIHMNSFTFIPPNQAVVSLLLVGTVVKVDLTTGELLWKIGVKNSDFEFKDDPLGHYGGLHSIHFLPNNHLLIFDNGSMHDPPTTRVVEYHVDEAAKTVRMVWEHRYEEFTGAAAGGVQRLDNGNTIISWGYAGVVQEVTPDHQVIWSAEIGPTSRAWYYPTLYPELE